MAEGTAQLMPAGSSASCVSYLQGNDGAGKEGPTFGRPWYDLVYVHIADPATELIYYGFTRKLPTNQPIYYEIIDPDGNLLRAGRVAETSADSGFISDNGTEAYVGPKQMGGGQGYDALTCVPTVAGDYAVRFNVGNDSVASSSAKYYIHPFDITVGDVSDPGKPDPLLGRLFSYKWHLNTNSSSQQACMQFYTWTPDSLVIMMDMNQIRPFGYTVSFNSYGATNTGDIEADRRSNASVSDAVPEYKVFLNEPDELVYPTGTPGAITYLDIEGCHADSSFCIEINTTKLGEVNVYIDLNGNGVYEEGTVDRYFPFNNSEVGPICVPWDGLDGFGNPVGPGTSGTVRVEFLAGEVHYPVYDPENHPNGFRCAMIRPSGFSPKMYFDNRNTPIGTYELDGCDSLCNTWTGSKGDKVMVNTWLNTTTSTDTDSFYITDVCPPQAYNDSACTTTEMSLYYAILANDLPGDYALSPSTVRILSLSDSNSSAMFLSEGQTLVVTPGESAPSEVTVTYEVCDSTPASLAGPLCDHAQMVVEITPGCELSSVLSAVDWHVSVQRQHRDGVLRWEARGELPIDYFVVERAAQSGGPFSPLGQVMPCGTVHRYVDMGVIATGWEWATYRIRAIQVDGASVVSPETALFLPGQAGVAVEVQAVASHLNLTYVSPDPMYVRVVDLGGKQIADAWLSAQLTPTQHRLTTAGWTPGWYLIGAYQQDWRVRSTRLWIGKQ
jgi:hypothetical protein